MGAERWEAVKRRVFELGRAHVRAGVVGPPAQQTHAGSGLTNGELALLHELGNPSTGLPARRPVGRTFEDPARRAEYEILTARLTRAVVDGKMSRDQALGLIGAWAAGAIRRTIVDGDLPPPLAPATVEAKQSDRILIDTGQLVGAIGFEVVK